MKYLVFASVLLSPGVSYAQTAWQIQDSHTSVELRGLSIVDSQHAWASGAKGSVLHTEDGQHWQTQQIPGAEQLDFRDIHAVSQNIVYVMSAGPGELSRIYKTVDAGIHWHLLTTNTDEKGFWNAISFTDAEHGMLYGDATDGQFYISVTADGGMHWQRVTASSGLKALGNEGAFAASGTCLSMTDPTHAWIVTGGADVARILRTSDGGQHWEASELPIPAGAASKGAFSVAFLDQQRGFVVGGDYRLPGLNTVNGARTGDGGKTWTVSMVQPQGFLSAVTTIPGTAQSYVAAGLAGSAYSKDAGKTWLPLSDTPLNTVAFANARTGWAVGPNGLLLSYSGPDLSDSDKN